MKMFEFRLKFHWSLFSRIQLIIFQHWFRLWLGAVQAPSHYLNQWWLIYWRIYASLDLNVLKVWSIFYPLRCCATHNAVLYWIVLSRESEIIQKKRNTGTIFCYPMNCCICYVYNLLSPHTLLSAVDCGGLLKRAHLQLYLNDQPILFSFAEAKLGVTTATLQCLSLRSGESILASMISHTNIWAMALQWRHVSAMASRMNGNRLTTMGTSKPR